MKRGPNPRVLFGLAAAVFFGSAGFLFLQNQGLNSKRARVAELGEQDREQQQIYTKLADSKKDLADLQDKLSHLEKGVPDEAYVPTMLKELELAGKQKGIEVTGLRPMNAKSSASPDKDKDGSQSKPYKPIDLELKGRGKYKDLLAFVEGMNTFPKIVAVRTVSIAPMANKKNDDHRLEITIGLRAFVFGAKDQKSQGGSV